MDATRPEIELVIVDLDNTLYDWVSSFVPSFYAMVAEAAQLLRADPEIVLNQLRAVHQAHGNSEHPFALLETPIVEGAFPMQTPRQRRAALEPAFRAFNKTRTDTLSLYDSVKEGLATLKGWGVPVVAYTDAAVYNSLFRILNLGLKDVLSRLYAPGHIEEPLDVGQDTTGFDDLMSRFVRILDKNDRKPNPKTLRDIVIDFGMESARTLYIGDSLTRDIFMANRAGVRSAWAKYGSNFDPSLWTSLVRVTHWTESDVKREERLRIEARSAHPDVVLSRFADIFDYFSFPRSVLCNLS